MGAAIVVAAVSACSGGSGGIGVGGPTGGGGSSSSVGSSSNSSGSAHSPGGGSSSSSSSYSSSSPPVSTGTPMGQTAAARLLMQGTFGATLDTINSTAQQSYDDWFNAQGALKPTLTLPQTTASFEPAWFSNAVTAQDQLRQRVAFALSEIMVVSETSTSLFARDKALAYYYDILINDSLGSFRKLLQDVTLSPAMGQFLSMMRNDKPNTALGIHADQNYAREIMQLFTIGLVKLNLDGTVQTDGGKPVPTYTQADVEALSNVFTGWSSAPATQSGDNAWLYDYAANETAQMVAYEPPLDPVNHHDTDAKTITALGLNLPAGGTAESEMNAVLDALVRHPNVAPFISKQLIQKLVTSNPSTAYVQRVATVFRDTTGSGTQLLSVVKAILTDTEAVNTGDPASYGKLREPLLRLTNMWRAFNASTKSGVVTQPDSTLGSTYDNFNEYPLQAPSVFNFFTPSYQPLELANVGLLGPEFQITNENTLVASNNLLEYNAYVYIDGAGNGHLGVDTDMKSTYDYVALRSQAWEQYASDPATLVDKLNLVLMAGQMTQDVRNVLIAYATAVPAGSPGARVIETADLVINSPQYAIQR